MEGVNSTHPSSPPQQHSSFTNFKIDRKLLVLCTTKIEDLKIKIFTVYTQYSLIIIIIHDYLFVLIMRVTLLYFERYVQLTGLLIYL